MSAKRPPISIATNAVMVGDCEAVSRDQLVSVQLAIHPFEALINECTLSFAVIRKLLETALEDRTGILNRAATKSRQIVHARTIGRNPNSRESGKNSTNTSTRR